MEIRPNALISVHCLLTSSRELQRTQWELLMTGLFVGTFCLALCRPLPAVIRLTSVFRALWQSNSWRVPDRISRFISVVEFSSLFAVSFKFFGLMRPRGRALHGPWLCLLLPSLSLLWFFPALVISVSLSSVLSFLLRSQAEELLAVCLCFAKLFFLSQFSNRGLGFFCIFLPFSFSILKSFPRSSLPRPLPLCCFFILSW